MATLEIGGFFAHITELYCEDCKQRYHSKELRELVPHQSRFGFDVIVYIGESLFLRSRSEKEILSGLSKKNISISIREIGYLGKKFIVYLALAHKKCRSRIKQLMFSRGGYILHLDGTQEGDSPHLMSTLDSISDIVLDNVKIASENSDQIIPFLERIKQAYGNPMALVHDMGRGILNAIKIVFPGIRDFICHFHFLKDIGDDLFGSERAAIRKALRKYNVRALLKKASKALEQEIDKDPMLTECLNSYLQQLLKGKVPRNILPSGMAYTLISWLLDYKSELNGYGFPFDREYLVFYQRLETAKDVIKTLPASKRKDGSISQLDNILSPISNDRNLKEIVDGMQKKVNMFDQLREAMKIALPEGKKGLNDDGVDADMKTIKEKVTAFRNSKEVKKAASEDVIYKKMVNQIDKYWDKLFADPITVITSDGEKIIIYPQRTNNILERFFRNIKRMYRKRNGGKSLNRTLKAMLSDTPLVKNLQNPEYIKILLNNRNSLEECFADIEVDLVRQELREDNNQSKKRSYIMKKVLQIPDLPIKIAKTSKKVA